MVDGMILDDLDGGPSVTYGFTAGTLPLNCLSTRCGTLLLVALRVYSNVNLCFAEANEHLDTK